MIDPSEKVDIEEYDSLGAYLSDAMDAGYTLEAEDFEGRDCAYCGETIPFVDWPDGVVTWDVRVHDPDEDEPEPYYARYYYCSEECRHDAKLEPESHAEPTMIHVDDIEGKR